jgi:adenosylcobinamide-phosphate guanylyltransferase
MLIYGVLMCGGKGTRIKSTCDSKTEKPLIRIKNKPLIEYLLNSLNQTNSFEKMFAAVSNNTQKTREFINANFQNKIVLLETAGIEYSKDYLKVIKYFKNTKLKKEKEKEKESKKILFLPIDLPLISPEILKHIIQIPQEKPCLTIIVERDFVKNHGITPSLYEIMFNQKNCCYSGISLIDVSKIYVGDSKKVQLIEEEYVILNNIEIACNINTFKDLKMAENLMENFRN